jgi:hypothetical protein
MLQPAISGYVPIHEPSGRGLGEFVSLLSNPVVLEIGCDSGETTQFLLESNPKLEIHCIDPYIEFTDWGGNVVTNRQQMYESVLARFSGYGERYKQYRYTSNDALFHFQDDQFDLIFIDGLHTYEQVSWDCENYYSKVKTGGIFSGHDYETIPGVNRAVNEFVAKIGKTVLRTNNDVWYWIK